MSFRPECDCAVGVWAPSPARRRLQVCDTADCKSALRGSALRGSTLRRPALWVGRLAEWDRLLWLLLLVGKFSLCESAELLARTNLTVGLLLPADEPYRQSILQGTLLGVEQASRAEAVSASAIVRGAAGQWGTDGVEAGRMVMEDAAEALIAPTGGSATHLALQIAGRTGVPVISLCGDASVSQTGVRWMARITPSTREEARALFLHFRAAPQQSPAPWLAFVPPARAGREIIHDLSEAGADAGISGLRAMEVKWPLPDASSFLTMALTNHPGSVLFWLDPVAAGQLANLLRGLGFKGNLAGPGRLCCPEFVEAAGGASSECFAAVPTFGGTNRFYTEFAEAYHARVGCLPDFTATMSYDAARLLIHLLKMTSAGSAHAAFPIASDFSGATGVLSFDALGNRKMALGVAPVRSSPFEPLPTSVGLSPYPHDLSQLRAKAGELTPPSEVR